MASPPISLNSEKCKNGSDNDDGSCVQVAVRVRPMLPHEAGNTQCIEVLSTNSKDLTVVRLGGESGPKFAFDEVFPSTTSQHDVYEHRVAPLVKSCLQGYNATILAYGQTGSGKTHTIMGPSASITTAVQNELQAGVIPRAIRSVFQQLQELQEKIGKGNPKNSSFEYEVRVQFLEVYGEEIRDLLSPQQPSQKLTIRDVGMEEPEVVGATERKVDSSEEALLCLTRGMYRRVTGATAMNESSSRSHAILSLIVEQSSNTVDDETKVDEAMQHIQDKRSKFNFVDLAGSERQKRTQACGQRLKEGIDINKGLLVLGNVISALGDPKRKGKTFVPYRDSKLTRLLKGSLGGNHKTLMIACVSPAAVNMEETLNCLRYANRAKNIQNHAVVNMDATSRLVAELRGKMQMLAADLLKARDGKLSECTVPIEIVEQLAIGGDGQGLSSPKPYTRPEVVSPSPIISPPSLRETPQTIQPLRASSSSSLSSSRKLEEELQKLKAENEVLRLQVDVKDGGRDSSSSLQAAFIARAAEYEREIAALRRGKTSPSNWNSLKHPDFNPTASNEDQSFLPNLPPRTPNRRIRDAEKFGRSESPELSRLRAQAFGSMSQSQNLDAEMDAEEKAVGDLANKYLKKSIDSELDDSLVDDDVHLPQAEEQPAERLSAKLEGDLFELSNSIDAKEELIQKLLLSQQKYEAMRDFYDKKLQEMGALLAEKEMESEKLVEELQKVDKNNAHGKELSERLREKQEQVATLKKKQAELTRLTTVASKNQSQIEKLRNEVIEMKHKKVDLQKQITNERKNHAAEVQKLKKESMQKDRELNKAKKVSDRKAFEAQKAQQVAKSRLDQINQLKNKYKETEKRQRMLTVKRGVMTKAGLDPVMVGRRQSKTEGAVKTNGKMDGINVDSLRDLFDQKVADIGRKESLAEKLAQEWEAHFELTISREELIKEGYEESSESIQSVDSQIQYKKERIRQLASRLGKRKSESENPSKGAGAYLFDQKFQEIAGDISLSEAAETAAKVLFGMVVRERRRIASLARTASSLDERVQEAEAEAAAKDAAFRAYVDEQRLETAALAQDQQEHILSLMELVRETPADSLNDSISPDEPEKTFTQRRGSISDGHENSKLLVLANERIAVLERQLDGLQSAREAIRRHREGEEEARALLEEKSNECSELEAELSDLRSALRRIRESYALGENGFEELSSTSEMPGNPSNAAAVFNIVNKALHPSPGKPRNRANKRRSSSTQKIPESPTLSIKNQTKFVHTSDSDEMPDWAEDIMQDLAIIAEGKMPESLLDSIDVSGGDSIDASGENQNEDQDVFDRLTNPEKFTGVQKQKKLQGIRNKKGKAPIEGVSEGQRQRKLISKQVADSLNKVVIPSAKTPAKEKEKSTTENTEQRRSVFDRLLSPSNLTGTQKQRYQEKKNRRTRSGSSNNEDNPEEDASIRSRQSSPPQGITNDDDADDLLDDILSREDDATNVAVTTHRSKYISSKRDQWKELSVFERLNRTTTQAYAVKQNVNIAEKLLDDILDQPNEDERHKSEPVSSGFERVDEYTQQNVFERLQKNTTHAYAVKHVVADNDTIEKRHHSSHSSSGSGSPGRQKSKHSHSALSPRVASEHEDVFERLQRQTTEAYLMKINPPIDYNGSGQAIDTQNDVRHLRSNAIETGSFGSFSSSKGQEDPPEARDIGYPEADGKHRRFRVDRQEAPLSPDDLARSQHSATPSTEYENVFERLQKTSTEAFAKKISAHHAYTS